MTNSSFTTLAGALLLAACGQQAGAPKEAAPVEAAAAQLPASETAEAGPVAGFDRTLTAGPFGFRVVSANAGSIGSVTVTPTGLSEDSAAQQAETDGTVIGAETGDVDGDGFPEVYVFTQSAGSGSYGAALGWAVNKGKSMTPIMIPDLPEDDAKLLAGYQGHDRFQLAPGGLTRSFPVYREGDPNSAPTGGTRTITYTLKPGEAAWKMVLVRSEDS